jgi:hypothetical protein
MRHVNNAPLQVDVADDGVATLTLNRPDKRNALSIALRDALSDPLKPATVAVANIALGPIVELADRLACRRLVSSGYLVSDLLELDGWRRLWRLADEGWAADVWEVVSE